MQCEFSLVDAFITDDPFLVTPPECAGWNPGHRMMSAERLQLK
ncbi:MAG: hypothetical protein R2688_09500 [Fimbriimonadaceae bacterium]